MKKIFIALSICAAFTFKPAYTYQYINWKYKKNPSTLQYAHKRGCSLISTTLKACAVAGTIALAGSAIALIRYMCRFNIDDAQDLIKAANLYKTATEEYYAQAFSILGIQPEEERIQGIKALIIQEKSATPYFLYAQKTSNSLKECNKLLKKIQKGTPKLKARYQKLQTHAYQYEPLKLADEMDNTEKALEDLKKIEAELSVLADQIQDLCIICMRTEEYLREAQMIHLAAINDSLNSIRIQNALNTATPYCYYTPVYYRYY
jgi:hypothetical protein